MLCRALDKVFVSKKFKPTGMAFVEMSFIVGHVGEVIISMKCPMHTALISGQRIEIFLVADL